MLKEFIGVRLFYYLFLSIVVVSCSLENNKYKLHKNKLFGTWKTERFQVGSVSGFCQTPLQDSMMVNAEYLCNNFLLKLRKDSSYIYTNCLGKSLIGKYNCKDDFLKLKIRNYDWLTFVVDSLSDSILYLNRKEYARFFYIDHDTINQHTGNHVTIVLRKINALE